MTIVAALIALATLAGAAPPGVPWRAAPAYVSLFAPTAEHDSYQAWVTPRSLDDVLRAMKDDPLLLHSPGAWDARALIASDAFGTSGPYDRARLARVYGAQRVRVARGPRGPGGCVTESWLLLSPYPDPSLQRLEPGTLLIVLRVPDL